MSKADMIMKLLEEAFDAGEDFGFLRGMGDYTDYNTELKEFLNRPSITQRVHELAEME